MKEVIQIHGFFRVQLGEDSPDGKPKVIGDSGWVENEVVNEGFQDYVCKTIGAIAGSKQATYLMLGTGTAPNATHTDLEGSTKAGTCSNSVVSSKTLQATIEFASGDHPGGTPNIRNIALLNSESLGTILCGQTFTSSTWNSNQGVSATYQLRFGTSS